jgi:hypothetical protein
MALQAVSMRREKLRRRLVARRQTSRQNENRRATHSPAFVWRSETGYAEIPHVRKTSAMSSAESMEKRCDFPLSRCGSDSLLRAATSGPLPPSYRSSASCSRA